MWVKTLMIAESDDSHENGKYVLNVSVTVKHATEAKGDNIHLFISFTFVWIYNWAI